MYAEFMGGGISIFFVVSVVFTCIQRIARHFLRLLHAELPSNLLMEPACYFANYLDGLIVSLLIQAHWENADSCRSGHSSGSFFSWSPLRFFYISSRRDVHPEWNLQFYFSSRCATARSHQVECYGRRKPGSHTNTASSLEQLVPSVFTRRVARARLGTHSCAAPREKEECAVDRVCHVSLRAGRCLPGKLSDATPSTSPTQKGERRHQQ